MRPIDKPQCNDTILIDGSQHIITSTYKPHTEAQQPMEAAWGRYCSYCEEANGNLEVEHIIPQSEAPALKHSWDNFLLACRRCNGTDNKGNQPVKNHLLNDNIYFPHLHNTLLIFEYKQGGIVTIHPSLNSAQAIKANNLLQLVKLDKYPGNPKYSTRVTSKRPYGYPNNDNRWRIRREVWETAQRKLIDYQKGQIQPDDLADYAAQKGFFSIWYTLFKAHTPVLAALIKAYIGTAHSCFDPQTYLPIPRNPHHTQDPI